jgi:hypothetical protein
MAMAAILICVDGHALLYIPVLAVGTGVLLHAQTVLAHVHLQLLLQCVVHLSVRGAVDIVEHLMDGYLLVQMDILLV